MKRNFLFILIILLLPMIVLPLLSPRAQHVAGSIRIPARGIEASVYTSEVEPIDGMSTLWNGGKVMVKADLSAVQLGDMAEIYTVEGEHLVLECIDIRKGLWWLRKPRGDVLVVNGRWVYRFTRL